MLLDIIIWSICNVKVFIKTSHLDSVCKISSVWQHIYWYPQGLCLKWGPVTKPDWQREPAAPSAMRTFSHSSSLPVYYKVTVAPGAFPTMHCAERRHCGPERHPSQSPLFSLSSIWPGGLWERNLSSEWEVEDFSHSQSEPRSRRHLAVCLLC